MSARSPHAVRESNRELSGVGIPAGTVEVDTRSIAGDDECTWIVVRPGVSRLKYMSSACPYRRRHVAAVAGGQR